jgi:hypothetical protein
MKRQTDSPSFSFLALLSAFYIPLHVRVSTVHGVGLCVTATATM